ncbi:PHP domain-containing protein [bacterium]|nr:PHP domain-containing protein [bacterium]
MKNKNKKFIDLHIHSLYSDGSFTPKEVIERAVSWNLSAISITDHDTVEGSHVALDICKDYPIEVISGIEFSTVLNGTKIHVLGYFIDVNNEELLESIKTLRADRYKRAHKIVDILNNLGIDIKFEEVEAYSSKESIGRPHIAALMTDKGYVKKISFAFDKYIGEGKPAFVPKNTLGFERVLELIHLCGGLSILAHPGVIENQPIIKEILEYPIDGLEVFYPFHKPSQTEKLKKLAESRGLLITGGSDCHGMMKGEPLLGLYKIEGKYLDRLKEKHRALTLNSQKSD